MNSTFCKLQSCLLELIISLCINSRWWIHITNHGTLDARDHHIFHCGKWPNLTFHKEPRPISLGATTLGKVIMFRKVIIFRMRKLSFKKEANGFSIMSYPYTGFHQTCTWSIVIKNIGLSNCLIVVNGLLITNFILPSIYNCPSWSRIHQRKFEGLKPYFVKQCKDKNVYCCKYQMEFDLLRQGLNGLRDGIKGVHVQNACTCQCGVCQ